MKNKKILFTNERGVALMMILWVMVLLDIIVLQFASSMRTEGTITRNFRDRVEAYYLARAGVEMARLELMYVGSKPGTHSAKGEKSDYVNFLANNEDIEQPFKREISLGRGGFYYKYSTNKSKRNLNKLAKNIPQLEQVLELCGLEPASAEMSQLSHAIYDWVDNNSEVSHPDSAENEWYKENCGYPCKNGDFDSLDELKLIRWLRQEDTDSQEERENKEMILKKLVNLVHADLIDKESKMNENFASKEVLESAGKTDEEIKQIFDDIKDKGYYTNSNKPSIYNVISTGWISDSISNRKILAMYKVSKDAPLLKWVENFTDNNNKNPFEDNEEN